MYKDRIRTLLYEASVIVLSGIAIAICATLIFRYFDRPTIAEFRREYFAGDVYHQAAIAEKYMRDFPVAALLQVIEEESASGMCHIQGHGIGRAIYKTNPNFGDAIRTCGGSCTHGCFHGAMLEMFQTDSDTLGGAIESESASDTLAAIIKAAPDLCSRPDVASVVKLRYCTHGIGHAFSYMSGNDLDRAVRDCDVLKEEHAINPCVSGAFMETFFSTSSASYMGDLSVAPCDRFPGTEILCYRYRVYGWLVAHGLEQSFDTCASLGERLGLICIRSVAMAAARAEMMQKPNGLDPLCGTFTGEKRVECFIGAYLKIIDSNNGDDSDRLCDIVDVSYRSGCLSTLHDFRDSLES